MTEPIEIVNVGLAAGGPPRDVAWPLSERARSRVAHDCRAIGRDLRGSDRFDALAEAALADLGERDAATPVVLASCNGKADGGPDAWRRSFPTPMISTACASGVQAIFVARALLASRAANEVIVLAVDILSQANHANFESLRVLSATQSPRWQQDSTGFLLGEAAVALRLRRADDENRVATKIWGPILGRDWPSVLGVPVSTELIIAQGTGPALADLAELEALDSAIESSTPIVSPVYEHGHTLASSGLLGLAKLVRRERLLVGASATSSGRPIDGRLQANRILAFTKAMGGACTSLATAPIETAVEPSYDTSPLLHSTPAIPEIAELVSQAATRRPDRPPGALILRLHEPFLPPSRMRIGDRLLPAAVVEITPGFAALAIARAWGYQGPTMCIVGGLEGSRVGPKTPDPAMPWITAVDRVCPRACVIYVNGDGVEWDVSNG